MLRWTWKAWASEVFIRIGEQANESDERAAAVERLRQAGALPPYPLVQSGAFAILDGKIVIGPEAEADRSTGDVAPQTQVIGENVVVQGRMCVGDDCEAAEDFWKTVLRLKFDNLRIHFDDSSTLAGFPANDWRIVINDSESGGASYFGIQDYENHPLSRVELHLL